VRHGDTAVSHELDEVAIRQSIADVPEHAQFGGLARFADNRQLVLAGDMFVEVASIHRSAAASKLR
jgi:hypothetical protein